MMLPSYRRKVQSGFTLIELIIVIVITGIIAAVIAPIMGSQFQAYTDSSRRATLVQEAQSVMQQLERDLYFAVPNSTQADGQTIELLLLSRDADSQRMPTARYNEDDFDDGNFDADDEFGVFGCFTAGGSTSRIVVASRNPNETLEQYDDESSPGPTLSNFALTEVPDCIDDNPAGRVQVTEDHDFGDTSTFHRLYMTDGKVTYTCNENGLTREQDFGVTEGLVTATSLSDTDACEFEPIPGGTFSPPSLLVRITLSSQGESITLARTFQLVNAP